jgi:hypothetical protein
VDADFRNDKAPLVEEEIKKRDPAYHHNKVQAQLEE